MPEDLYNTVSRDIQVGATLTSPPSKPRLPINPSPKLQSATNALVTLTEMANVSMGERYRESRWSRVGV